MNIATRNVKNEIMLRLIHVLTLSLPILSMQTIITIIISYLSILKKYVTSQPIKSLSRFLIVFILIIFFTCSGALASLVVDEDFNDNTLGGFTLEYGNVDVSNGYLLHVDSSGVNNTILTMPCTNWYGTISFDYRIPTANNEYSTGVEVSLINGSDYNAAGIYGNYLRFQKGNDEHTWLYFMTANRKPIHFAYNNLDYPGSNFYPHKKIGTGWHTVTIIHREEDNAWMMFLDGEFVTNSLEHEYIDFTPEKLLIRLYSMEGIHPMIDNVKVYTTYEYPLPNSITYYSGNNTIVASGASITLSDIVTAIDDSDIIAKTGTKTTITKARITLAEGSALYMNDESLVFDGTSINALKLYMNNGARLEAYNSTITSANSYTWQFDFVYNVPHKHYANIISYDGAVILDNCTISKVFIRPIYDPDLIRIINSYVSYEGRLFYIIMSVPGDLWIENTVFTSPTNHAVELRPFPRIGNMYVVDSVFKKGINAGGSIHLINCTGMVSSTGWGTIYHGTYLPEIPNGMQFVENMVYNLSYTPTESVIGDNGWTASPTHIYDCYLKNIADGISTYNGEERAYYISSAQTYSATENYEFHDVVTLPIDQGEPSEEPVDPPESSGSGTSFTPSTTSFTSSVGSSTTFSVDSDEQFTSAKWYFNGAEVASGTSYTQNWAASGTFTVRFDGVTDLGTLSRTWDVIVSGSEYSDISIIPSAATVKPGETFSLDVYIDPKQPVTGAQFNLQYGTLASVTSVKDGGLFKTGGLTNTFQSGTIDNSAGVLRNVYSAIMGTGTVSTPGSMATVNMTAGASSGMLELTMSNVVLSDAYSNPAPYDISYASVLVDTAPVFNTIPAKSVEEESTLAFTVSATDADGDLLTYSCTSLPQGATFDASAKTFSWTPSRGQAGTYSVVFSVTDGYLNDSATAIITVSTLDLAPVITLFEPASGSVFEEGQTIDLRVVAEDPEGNVLSYIMTIDGLQVSSSASHEWVTDYSSAGTHSIGVTVSDGNTQASRTHTITITDVHPRWDVNQDGVVNILDITLVGQNYGKTYTGTLPRWDVNQDGIVNIQDMSIVAGRFGETL